MRHNEVESGYLSRFLDKPSQSRAFWGTLDRRNRTIEDDIAKFLAELRHK